VPRVITLAIMAFGYPTARGEWTTTRKAQSGLIFRKSFSAVPVLTGEAFPISAVEDKIVVAA
jgi:hypothetical protein